MSIIFGILIFYLFQSMVGEWYRDGIAVMTSVAPYELGLYIAIGVAAVIALIGVCTMINGLYWTGIFVMWGLIITGFFLSSHFENRLIHFGFAIAAVVGFWYTKITYKFVI